MAKIVLVANTDWSEMALKSIRSNLPGVVVSQVSSAGPFDKIVEMAVQEGVHMVLLPNWYVHHENPPSISGEGEFQVFGVTGGWHDEGIGKSSRSLIGRGKALVARSDYFERFHDSAIRLAEDMCAESSWKFGLLVPLELCHWDLDRQLSTASLLGLAMAVRKTLDRV